MTNKKNGVRYLFSNIVAIILAVAPLFASAEPKWDYSNKIEYKNNGDPGWIAFMDGSSVTIVYEKLTFDIAETWLPGKTLTIGYNEKLGAVLYDSESNQYARILQGLTPHPIDIISDKCFDGSTRSNCFNESYRRWNVELARVIKVYLANLHARAKAEAINISAHPIENTKQQEKAILAAQVQWLKFRDAQIEAIGQICLNGGTISGNLARKHMIDVVREQAQRYTTIESW